MGVKTFQELEAWKEARKLMNMAYAETHRLKDFGLRDQIRRACVSVMANIAEGFSCSSDKHFMKYLRTSLGSASEVQSHLFVLLDQKFISTEAFTSLFQQSTSTVRLIRGLLRHLQGKTQKAK
jgi:four helix bundle protein